MGSIQTMKNLQVCSHNIVILTLLLLVVAVFLAAKRIIHSSLHFSVENFLSLIQNFSSLNENSRSSTEKFRSSIGYSLYLANLVCLETCEMCRSSYLV